MRRILLIPVALAVLLPAAGTIPHTRAAERAVAVTFDDLPATPPGMVANDVASLNELTRKLLNAVRKYGVAAVGFVNEGKLFVAGAAPGHVEGRIGVLRMWLEAGLELGNHTYSHRDLNRTPLEDDAYRLPDEFVGAPANSWFNHWEVTAGRKPVPTPRPPEWIRRAASAH